MKSWMKRKVGEPLVRLMKQGMSPEKLAQCVSIGLFIAIFPALGVTTLMAALAALCFRLNMVAIQTVNYAAYPLQFILLIPFYRAGAFLFHDTSPLFSASDLATLVRNSPWLAINQLWTVTWHAAVVWAIVATLTAPCLSLVLTPLFRRWAHTELAQ